MKQFKVTEDLFLNIYSMTNKKTGENIELFVQLMQDHLLSVFKASPKGNNHYHVYDSIAQLTEDWEIDKKDLIRIEKAIEGFKPIKMARALRKPGNVIDARPQHLKELDKQSA